MKSQRFINKRRLFKKSSNIHDTIKGKHLKGKYASPNNGGIKMPQLIVQSIESQNLQSALELLRQKDLLSYDGKCILCGEEIKTIGGFIPNHGKVSPVCDSVKCTLEASFAVMKHNGNGVPILENE